MPASAPPTARSGGAGERREQKGVDHVMYLAYLDPGSGTMLAAAVVAGFAGVMVAVRTWGRRVWGKIRRQRPAEAPAPASTDPDL